MWPILDELFNKLIVALVLAWLAWLVRIQPLNLLRNMLSRTPTIRRFKRDFLNKYKPFPQRRWWRPWSARYYVRREYEPAPDEKPTYHFFTEESVEIQEFMGFLIPPLDSGHGRLDPENHQGDSDAPRLSFNKNWGHYLKEIGEQAKRSSENPKLRNRRYHFFHPRVTFKGRRIIFFDKRLLFLFIQESDWIIELSRDKDFPYRAGFALGILRYAFDIATMHSKVGQYNNYIECHYLDKSQARATQYYDFGYYKIDGVAVVYNPIYRKNSYKQIGEEKIFIGNRTRQMEGIAEYTEAFDALWKKTSSNKVEQEYLLNNVDASYYATKDYYEFDSLTLPFFDQGYYASLQQIFRDKLDRIIV